MLKTGLAKEARQMSETQISGGGSDGFGNVSRITSRTTHFNRVRVEWDGGGESFHDFHSNISVGDRVAVVSDAGKPKGEANLTTGEVWYNKVTIGCLMLLAILACIPLMFLYFLGVAGWVGIFLYIKSQNAQIRAYVDGELAGAK